MPLPFQSTTGLIFVTNFLLSFFLHDYFSGIGIFAIIYFAVFFVSDFSFTPPDVGIYYHVWSLGLALVSSLAGFYYSLLWKTWPMIVLQGDGEKQFKKVSWGTIAVQLHVIIVALLAFGINSWADRPNFGGGVYPFGVNLVTPGIAVTCISILGLVITTILLITRKQPGFKHTAKYIWLLPLVPSTIVINDIGNYVWWYQLLMFIAFAVAWVIVYLLAVYLPTGAASDQDQFYHHKTFAAWVFGIAGMITLLGLLLLWIVVVWALPSSSLETGMIVMICYAGAVLIGSIIGSLAMPAETYSSIALAKPIPVESRADGDYAILSHNGVTSSIRLTERFV